jgi:glycerol-3-phosphate responsive antiterminator
MSTEIANDRNQPVIRLPRVLVADDGHRAVSPPPGLDAAILLRNTDLGALIDRALSSPSPPAVEIDTVRGLETDKAAVDFLRRRLGIGILLTRRPQTATQFAELGGLALLSVLAFDSTGLARSLTGHPRRERVGTVVSPGLVLAHMQLSELAVLPRPVVAYGLISTAADARAGLERADSVVLLPAVAAAVVAADGSIPEPDRISLTTVGAVG